MTPEDWIEMYEQALATQKWENAAPLIHEDACVTFSDGTYKGKDKVQKAFERTFSLIEEEQYSITDLYWIRQTPEFAVCLYRYNWSGIIRGEQASGSGRGTSLLINQGGQWQLLSEHLGPNPT